MIYTKHCVFPLGRVMGSPVGRLAGHVLDACLSDGAIAVSPSVRELLLQSGVPDRKIHVLFNGVAPWRPLRRGGADRTAGGVRLWAGGLRGGHPGPGGREYKGHSVLLDAAEQLLSQGRRVKVLVAGEGRAEAALRLRAVSFPQGTVFFAGFIERVERALWAMDAQINASTESEGTSLSLLEGMSFGLPAVVSDIGGNPLLIQDGENGLVFPQPGQPGPGRLCGTADG